MVYPRILPLIVGPCHTKLGPCSWDDTAWLARTLTIELPVPKTKENYSRYRLHQTAHVPKVRFFDAQKNTFPSGLCAYVAQAAENASIRILWSYQPASHILAPVAAPTAVSWPDGRELRPYQVGLVCEALKKGRGIVQAATGSGKTPVIAALLRCLGCPPSIVIVNSRSLVRQTRRVLEAWTGQPVGEIAGGKVRIEGNTTVVLPNSLGPHLGEAWAKEFLATRRVLILDEAHHVTTGGPARKDGGLSSGLWYEVSQRCPAPNRYGFSATPLKFGDPEQNWRLVAATGPIFDRTINASTLIESGFAARPHIYFLDHDSAKVRATKNRKTRTYHEVYEEAVVECATRNEAITRAAVDLYMLGIKVLVLVERKLHGEILEKMICATNAKCRFTHGALDKEKQEDLLDWLREPGPRILVATRVLGEGTDVPDLGGMIYAKGGKAYVSIFQGIGRAVRPKGGVDDAGACIIVVPDDKHAKKMQEHVDLLKAYLTAEPAFRVALPGQSLPDFARAVLCGEAEVE